MFDCGNCPLSCFPALHSRAWAQARPGTLKLKICVGLSTGIHPSPTRLRPLFFIR